VNLAQIRKRGAQTPYDLGVKNCFAEIEMG